jgi:5-methylcytosine-specific restriction endonuclease McrA
MHGTCANCGHYSTNVEIDHASTPFCEIATVAFHDQRADFQILCPTCNNKKKQYKKLNKLFFNNYRVYFSYVFEA